MGDIGTSGGTGPLGSILSGGECSPGKYAPGKGCISPGGFIGAAGVGCCMWGEWAGLWMGLEGGPGCLGGLARGLFSPCASRGGRIKGMGIGGG